MEWRIQNRGRRGTLRTAQEMAAGEGPAAALRYLGTSRYAQARGTLQLMHELVWANRASLPRDLLFEPFLDPVWCRCGVCSSTWLIPPRAADGPHLDAVGQVGGRCPKCEGVMCAGCARLTDARCVCLAATVAPLHSPTGRASGTDSVEPMLADPEVTELESRAPQLRPWDLYFRRYAWPIGVDPQFPRKTSATPADHLRWAEHLTDWGVYPQADQQLHLLSGAMTSEARARANWIRARLELVRLRTLSHLPSEERSRYLRVDEEPSSRRARTLLEDALAADPDAAEVWLTAADAYLDPLLGRNPTRAIACASRARALLGEAPPALLALGRALIAAGRTDEAFAVLHRLPPPAPAKEGDAAAGGNGRGPGVGDQGLAALMARCAGEPDDPDACLQLGRRYLRERDFASATAIFEHLVARRPDHPAGYVGLGRLALVDFDLPIPDRLVKAHGLCRQALARDERSGLAHELLGLIYEWGESLLARAGLERGDPLECFQKAVAGDPTCDLALRSLAEEQLRRGRLAAATELLERAAKLGSGDQMVYRLLDVIYLGTRRFGDQQRAHEMAEWLEPDVVLVREYREKILALCRFQY